MKQGGSAAHGHARKHTHASKHVHGKHPKHHPHHAKTAHHHHARAHAVHTVGHHQSHAKGLAASPGDVACCVSQALAESLRLCQGLPVTGDGVLALHRAAGADDERGAPVLAVLEAASEIGMAGVRLDAFDLVGDLDERCGDGTRFAGAGIVGAFLMAEQPDRIAVHGQSARQFAERSRVDGHLVAAESPGDALFSHGGSLILGLDLPGPHTVLATPEGWWSWGELFCPWCDFPDAVVGEAWVIAWR